MYCPECGKECPPDAKYCSSCGFSLHADINDDSISDQNILSEEVKQSETNNSTVKKSPSTAAILSFLFLGAGQVYNGQLTPAILLLVASFFGALVTNVYSLTLGLIIRIAVLLGGVVHPGFPVTHNEPDQSAMFFSSKS
jgi:TM2 domain-containing membrane protein YozV